MTHVEEAFVTGAEPNFAVGSFAHGNHGRIGFGEAMRRNAGCPTETAGKLVRGDLGCAGSRIWGFGRRAEQFKSSRMVGERAKSKRCKKHRAIPAFEKRSDSELRDFTAELEFSLVVTQDFGALQKDPKVALLVGSESLHGSNRKRGRSGLGKIEEPETVEANQSFFRADPQVAVRRLRKCGDGASGETLFAAPMFPHVLRHNAIGIKGLRKRSRARQRQCGNQALAQPAPHSARVKGDIRMSQPQPDFHFATDFFRWRPRKTGIEFFPGRRLALRK